jgi:hypothetical protein
VNAATKPVLAYDEAELVNLFLCMCPESWQDQYDLMQHSLPQGVRKLLDVLKNVEKLVANSNTKEKAVKEGAAKATRKHNKVECARQWQVQRLLTKVVAKFMSYDLQNYCLQN